MSREIKAPSPWIVRLNVLLLRPGLRIGSQRAAGAGDLARGRRHESVRLVELPVAERGPVLREFLRQVPGGVRFFGMSSDPAAIVAAADRYPVFRIDASN